jgi:hypothetical protein
LRISSRNSDQSTVGTFTKTPCIVALFVILNLFCFRCKDNNYLPFHHLLFFCNSYVFLI